MTSALSDPRLDETQVLGALIPQEKAKQADGHDLAQGSPPTVSASVQFIGINYVPPESTDGQTTPLPAPPPASPLHPLPWESGPSPSSDGHVVIGLSTFVPKPPAAKRSVPVSSYYFGPPPQDSAYFTPPVGQIGVHHPREIVRVERDYSGGEIVQFSSTYPTEFEGRITPTQFLESINAINEILISAYSLWYSVFDNCVEIFSLQLSRLVLSTHYERVRLLLAFGRREERLLIAVTDHVPQLGDGPIKATRGRTEPSIVQSCGPEHALAEKSGVYISGD